MKSVTLIALNAKYCHTSLAIRSIAAVCRARGICATTVERTVNEPFRDLIKAICAQESDVYAFSCYLWNIELVKQLCVDLKVLKPHCEILLGGPEVSYDPEEYPFADVVVCGEGETAVADYLTGKCTGSVIRAEQPASLDELPFCYTEEDLRANRDRLIYYESSRGCPFRCSYCLSSVEHGVRFLSTDRVFSDLSAFDRAGVRLVKFVDRTFNADRRRALAIWKFAAEQCHTTSFHFELAGELLGEEELQFLATVPRGRFQFEIGIQSTCGETLAAVDRPADCQKLFAILRRLISFGNIPVHTDLIVGMPYETYRRFAVSFNEVYSLRSDCMQVGFLKLLKGSKIRAEADRFHYCYSAAAPYEVYQNDFLQCSEVFRLERIADAVERFYNSHAFDRSLDHLLRGFPSAFAMFEALSDALPGGGIAQRRLYRILSDFGRERLGEDPLFDEWLKFDWFCHTACAALPPFLGQAPNLQPTLFSLLGTPGFCERYLPQVSGQKPKEIVKSVFLQRLFLPEERYFLFTDEKAIPVSGEYFEIRENTLQLGLDK